MNILGSEIDSPWVKTDTNHSDDPVQIVVSSHGVKKGNFELRSSLRGHDGTRIYLNTPNADFYQSGIPELTESFDALIVTLRDIIGGRDTIIIGARSGGYAAIRIGAHLGANTVIAFSPIIDLNAPLAPIRDDEEVKGIPTDDHDLALAMKRSISTRFILFAAEWDIFHMQQFARLNGTSNVITFGLKLIDTSIPAKLRSNGELNRLYKAALLGTELQYKPKDAGTLLSNPIAIDCLYRGKIASIANDWDSAYPLYQKAIDIASDCEAAIEQLAVYDLTKSDRDAATAKYRRCIELNPERQFYQNRLDSINPNLKGRNTDKSGEMSAREWRDLGESLSKGKDYSEAASAYEKAYKLEPNSIGSGVAWAKAVFLSGNKSVSLRILKDMHKTHPENAIIAHNYGVLSLKAGKTRQALKFLGMAHNKDSRNPGFAHQYAVALMRARKARKALEPARLAAEERPENAGFHVTVAEIADALGDKAAANEAILQALSLHNEHAAYHALAARILEKSQETLDQAVKHMRNALTLDYGNEIYKNELVRLVEKQRASG